MGNLQTRASEGFVAKNLRFLENYNVSARIWKKGEGVSQCKQFADKEGGTSIFGNLVRTSFMDGP